MSDAELTADELTQITGYWNSQNPASSDQLTTGQVNAMVTGSDQGKKDIRKLIRAIIAAMLLLAPR